MTVANATSDIDVYWVRISGTIAEVLNELSSQGYGPRNVVSWTDGGTNAVAVACRQK